MTHYCVTVCTDDPSKLTEIMAPWNEELQVEPYRNYESGRPDEFYMVKSLREKGKLPEGELTWRQVADAFNAEYAEGADGEPDPEDGEYLHTDGEQAWRMTTYNPKSKWDWYSVGGRYAGRYPYRKGCAKEVIRGQQSWAGPAIEAGHCDGGPKRALDLDKMQDEAEARARARYAEFCEIVKGTPVAIHWEEFIARTKDTPGYDIDRARAEYHSQPRLIRLRESQSDLRYDMDAIETYQGDLDAFVARQRAKALAGWAIVTTDREWMEPGKMGWWAVSSATENEEDVYRIKAANYIRELPGDTYLITVDCHI